MVWQGRIVIWVCNNEMALDFKEVDRQTKADSTFYIVFCSAFISFSFNGDTRDDV